MAMASEPVPRCTAEAEACCVSTTIELVIGVAALGRISILAGVKVQEDWSGRPEQESVTNIGAVRDELFSGVTEAVMKPDVPGVKERVAGATEIWKSGAAVDAARTGVT